MNNSEFQKLADETLQTLADNIEDADTDYQLDIELQDGILNIELPDGGQYVINRHIASSQIWMSSPVSGAHHFSYSDGKWISSAGVDFLAALADELKGKVGVSL